MKRSVSLLIYTMPLMLYALSFAFLVNQPIELVNPFEYYNELDKSTFALYMMTILFVSHSMFGFMMGYRYQYLARLNHKKILILLGIGLCMTLFFSRMSVVLGIALTIIFIQYITNKNYSYKTLMIVMSLIYAIVFFALIVPMMLLWYDYESYLDISQFQYMIDTYKHHQMIPFIQLNITLLMTHMMHYILVLFTCMMPGALLGMAHSKRKFSIANAVNQALVCLIIGTAVKLLIFKFSFGLLQFALLIFGSSLQGIGLCLLLFIVECTINKGSAFQFRSNLFLTMIIVTEFVMYGLYTGIGKLSFPAASLADLLQQSLVISLMLAVLYIFMGFWQQNTLKNK